MRSYLKLVLHDKALKMKNPKKVKQKYLAESLNPLDSQKKFLQKVFIRKLKASIQNQ